MDIVSAPPSPTGRDHGWLSTSERGSLRFLMRWALENKESANFSPIWGSDGPDGEWGIWRWRTRHGRIALTNQPRGILVEFSSDADPVAYGFVWNTILSEFNDALLPKHFGRGYFLRVLGIDRPKTENEICAQNLRVNHRLFWRKIGRSLSRWILR